METSPSNPAPGPHTPPEPAVADALVCDESGTAGFSASDFDLAPVVTDFGASDSDFDSAPVVTDAAPVVTDFAASLVGLADWPTDRLLADGPLADEPGEFDYVVSSITPTTATGLTKVLAGYQALFQTGQVRASAREQRVLIKSFESLIATLYGLQAQTIDAYDRLIRANNAAHGIAARDQGRGVKKAVAMATHSSSSRTDKIVSTAKLLTHELPCTYRALCAGRISYYRAEIIATEAHKLPTSQRRRLFDERLAGDISRIETMGIRTLRRAAQSLVDEVHPVSAVERFAEEANASSQVSVEEIGCGMSRLIATMPTPHAAHIYSVLAAVADTISPIKPPHRDKKTGEIWMSPRGDPGIYHENDVDRSNRQSRGQAMTTTLYNMFSDGLRVVEPVETPELARRVVEPNRVVEPVFQQASIGSDVERERSRLSPQSSVETPGTSAREGHRVVEPNETNSRVVEPVETPGTSAREGHRVVEPNRVVEPVFQQASIGSDVERERSGLSPQSSVTVPDGAAIIRRAPAPIPVAPIPITIDLVISDRTLLGYGEEPAIILADAGRKNVGTVPAAIARALAATSIEAGVTWLRKIYVNDAGNLTATSSKQRFFPDGLATLLRLRDQGICRTPWCDAPIRHSDHIIPWCQGGETCLENGAGLCVRCNQDKEAPGWKTTVNTNPETGQQEITCTEPTGQTHKSIPPRLPKPAE